MNGLHFDRVYSASDKCEKALSPRLTAEKAGPRIAEKLAFPPPLHLPKPDDVTAWVKRNTFIGTQPFAEFVSVFEKAGDSGAARELRIQGETVSVTKNLCGAWGLYCGKGGNGALQAEDGQKSAFVLFMQRIEDRLVALLQYILWILADHGYRPERAVWFIIGTLLVYWLVVQLALGIVGFSVIDDKNSDQSPHIEPISLIFLFDKLIPAYQIRQDHSKALRFYVLADGQQKDAFPFRRFFRNWEVVEATAPQQRRMAFCLDALRLLGLIFAIFLVSALGRLVR